MRTLIVYYSFEGNTEFVAKNLAEELGADLLRLQPKKELQSHGFMKYFWGGKQATMREKPELQPLDKNPADYDFIILGTPVWAFTYAPPLRTFLATQKLAGKKIAVFCCHGGSKASTLEQMKKALVGNEVVGEIDFVEPLKHDQTAVGQRAREWARGLLKP